MTPPTRTVMFSAGEASGDRHGAHMFQELTALSPGIRGLGMGGAAMRAAGIDVRVDSGGIGVIGPVEILRHYREIRAALTAMQRLLLAEPPDLLICVDYKEFNLKLARFAKRHGIRVLFYVSPQVWAWRRGRVVTYGKAIDMMAVIFPFETAYYEAENVPVRYVGHPSVDKVQPLRSRGEDFAVYGLDPARPVVGILPGSRDNEIRGMLPVMLQAAQKLAAQHPGLQFLLPQADSITDALLETYLQDCPLTIKIVRQETYDAIQCCDAVMTTSGTATLEIALLGVPLLIAYRLSAISYWLGRWLVKIPFIGLPNIIAGRAVAREFIQHALTADNLATEIDRLLFDPAYRDACRQGLQQVKTRLGPGGGSRNMALLALEMLQSPTIT